VAESQISSDPGPGSDPGTVDSCYCYCSDSYCCYCCHSAVVRAALDLDPDICADCCYCYCSYSVILLCLYLCLFLYHRLCCRNADFDSAVRFAVAAVDGVDVAAVVAAAAVGAAHLHVAFSVDVAVVVVVVAAYLADVAVAAAAAL
jgi:hypothetical protein